MMTDKDRSERYDNVCREREQEVANQIEYRSDPTHKRVDLCESDHNCKHCLHYLVCMAYTPEGDRWPCYVTDAECQFKRIHAKVVK
jgi:hypothetical protein